MLGGATGGECGTKCTCKLCDVMTVYVITVCLHHIMTVPGPFLNVCLLHVMCVYAL